MSRRFAVPILLVALMMMNARGHATDWWLYMSSADQCAEATPFAKAVGPFMASPDALTKHYRSEGLNVTQRRDLKGATIAVDPGDDTGSVVFFSGASACEAFRRLINHRD